MIVANAVDDWWTGEAVPIPLLWKSVDQDHSPCSVLVAARDDRSLIVPVGPTAVRRNLQFATPE